MAERIPIKIPPGGFIIKENIKYINITNDTLNFYNPDDFFTQDFVLSKIRGTSWFSEYNTYRKQIKETKCKKTTAKKCYEDELSVQTHDPFEIDELTSWWTRYFAALVQILYGKQFEDPTFTFHPRALFYKILQGNFVLPCNTYQKRPHNENEGFLIKYGTHEEEEDWKKTTKYLTLARYAGIVEMHRVVDKRITAGVQPTNLPLSLKKDFTDADKHYTPKVEFDIKIVNEFPFKLQIPVIILFSEKSELLSLFEYLADKYFIAYYIGMGEISVSGAKQIYDFIKSNSRNGIILTFSDYDYSGINIPVALTRKIQYFIESDSSDKPNIIIYPFAISELQLPDLRDPKYDIPKNPKVYMRQKKTVSVYELVALELLAEKKGIKYFDYIDEQIIALFPELLIKKSDIDTKRKKKQKSIFTMIQNRINKKIDTIPTLKDTINTEISPLFDANNHIEISNYMDRLKEHVQQLESFKTLTESTNFVYNIQPLSIEPLDLTTVISPKEIQQIKDGALMLPEIENDFTKMTQNLIEQEKKRVQQIDLASDLELSELYDIESLAGKKVAKKTTKKSSKKKTSKSKKDEIEDEDIEESIREESIPKSKKKRK